MPFQPPDKPENQNFKIEKINTLEILPFTHLQHKLQSYDVMFLRYGVRQTEFFVILERFLSFYPSLDPENQNFENMKKAPGDIIILHKCTINDNHIMYGPWDMKCDWQNFLSFWTVFCPFTPLQPKKSKFWKTEKTTWRYHHFTQVHQK